MFCSFLAGFRCSTLRLFKVQRKVRKFLCEYESRIGFASFTIYSAQMMFNSDFRKIFSDNQTDLCISPCASITDYKGFPSYGDYSNDGKEKPFSYIKVD